MNELHPVNRIQLYDGEMNALLQLYVARIIAVRLAAIRAAIRKMEEGK